MLIKLLINFLMDIIEIVNNKNIKSIGEYTMFRISKKEEEFFDLFNEAMDKVVKTAEALHEMMTDYTNIPQKIQAIKDIEHDCDLHVHKILKTLNAAFITPIDREDIFLIAKEIDNIVDTIEATAHRFKMFNILEVRPDALKMSNLIVKCAKELKSVFAELKDLKGSKTIIARIIEVNRIENEGDEVFRSTFENLFVNEKNAIEIIKWKEILEYLENSIDAMEDVANIIEGVVMKHA